MKLTEREVLAKLRKNGYKLTPQRRAVIKIITSAKGHLTPATICEKIHRVHPDIGLVTIYRTLDLLAELGLVCELHTDGKHRSYTTGITQRHHHHLICSGCGTVVDFAGRHLEKLERSLSRESGFRIDDHLLEFVGLCRTCQKIP
ncbi:Fur family transcriptional regulator [Chloroflexota bacterium]